MYNTFRNCLNVGRKISIVKILHIFTRTPKILAFRTLSNVSNGVFDKQSNRTNFPPVTSEDVQLQVLANGLLIRSTSWPVNVEFPFIWLRDHCQCPECFDPIFLQKKSIVQGEWFKLHPRTLNTTNEQLTIQWSDNHKSSYDLKWLWENSFEGASKESTEPELQLWDARKLQSMGPPSVDYENLITEVDTAAQVIDNLLRVGVCFVNKIPHTQEATELAAKSVAPMMTSIWGSGMVILDSNESLELDYSYTNKALMPHNDGNFFLEGPGVQTFHMLKPSLEGGETILVDSFNIAEHFKTTKPEFYKILATTYINHDHKVKNQRFHRNLDVTFKLNPVTKKLIQVRYCPNDLAPLSTVAPSNISLFYQAYVAFKDATLKPDNQFHVKLCPGTMVMVNNWRVFHGRTAFTGHRVLCTGYISRSELLSRAINLGVTKNPF